MADQGAVQWHAPQGATLDPLGGERHPAYGSITAHRVSSNPGAVLFDSDVRHNHFVRVTISRATRSRQLGHDWHHPTQELLELDMSEAQWASFLSSMNTTGVPCTLRRVGDDVNVPGVTFSPRLAASMAEVHEAAELAFGRIKEALAVVDGLDAKAGVKDRREAMRSLRAAIQNATPNVDYAGRQLAEHAENVVQRARADIEAMAAQKAQQLALKADDDGPVIALELGDR